jgi:hypothetical protein
MREEEGNASSQQSAIPEVLDVRPIRPGFQVLSPERE